MAAALLVASSLVILMFIFQHRKTRTIEPAENRLPARARRGTAHAMLGLQQFVEPSVEFVFQARNAEQREEDDDVAGGDGDGDGNGDAVRRELAEALALAPVDPDEIRRHLVAAVRLGLDWREVYEEAVTAELSDRPYRRPMIPPACRVAPLT